MASADFIDGREDDGEINSAIGFRGWFSQASAKWRISFPYTTSTGQSGKIESELRFDNIDSPMVIVTGGGKMAPRFLFDVLYGAGSISGGRGTDIDRFVSSSGGGLDFSVSQNDVSGDVRMWGGNVYFNNALHQAGTRAGPWGMVLGFLHYEDSLTLRNGIQTNSVPFDGLYMPLGTFSGLNSTYDFSWNLVKVGVLHRARLSKGFSYSGLLAAYPYAAYRGEGYWNLRAGTNPDDFRVQSPNFIHESQKGRGYEGSLELIYTLSENMELTAGYRYFYLYEENGTDRVYFADGTSAESTLDWVTVTRQGAYAEMLFRF